MNIEQPLEGMTWGELRLFVAMSHPMSDADSVTFDYDEDLGPRSMIITGVLPDEITVVRGGGGE